MSKTPVAVIGTVAVVAAAAVASSASDIRRYLKIRSM
jgi:hypothetical protein